MGGAKDGVELLPVRRGGVDGEEQAFHLGQVLGALLEEDEAEGADIDGGC
ncbi:hypothetical protein [Geobacter pickeringii]|nr:hypothetical protein [Geobacter pickeringii]